MGLTNLRYVDSTDIGGSSYVAHIGHAAAYRGGQCEWRS